MFSQGRSYFGTLFFARFGVMLLALALQTSFLNSWLSSLGFFYYLLYAAMAVGLWLITWQEAVNLGGRDAQKMQGMQDRGESEEAQKQVCSPWYGLRYAAVLEAPFFLLALVSGVTGGLASILLGILPNLWNAAWMPFRDIVPGLFPWLYLFFGVITVGLSYLGYPVGIKRFALMRQHMLENRDRLKSNQKAIRIPRGK